MAMAGEGDAGREATWRRHRNGGIARDEARWLPLLMLSCSACVGTIAAEAPPIADAGPSDPAANGDAGDRSEPRPGQTQTPRQDRGSAKDARGDAGDAPAFSAITAAGRGTVTTPAGSW